MDKLMEALFDYITDELLEKYCTQTAYAERAEARDAVGRRLWEQLEGEQRKLLEQLQRAYDQAQAAELKAMFLASFDVLNSMSRRHIA